MTTKENITATRNHELGFFPYRTEKVHLVFLHHKTLYLIYEENIERVLFRRAHPPYCPPDVSPTANTLTDRILGIVDMNGRKLFALLASISPKLNKTSEAYAVLSFFWLVALSRKRGYRT